MASVDWKYAALAEWAVPKSIALEPSPRLKGSTHFGTLAIAFGENMDRVRAMATLPAAVAVRALFPDKLVVSFSDVLDACAKVDGYTKTKHWAGIGIEHLLASVVIGSWTAFEVLAGDLWIAVVNRFPVLGVRALDAEPLAEDDDIRRERKAKTNVQFAVQRFLDPDFDPKSSLGDALSECFPMSSFRTILAAYDAIFREKEATEIIRDQGIRSLSAVRNVLVHNAGIADEEFPFHVKSDQRFSHIKKGGRIGLDGSKVAELAESARTQGFKLIEFVDGWCNRPPSASARRT